MSTESTLQKRSDSSCELCKSKNELSVYVIPPGTDNVPDNSILTCSLCQNQISSSENLDGRHWHCLNDSIWSQTPAVQIVSWRLLKRLTQQEPPEMWASDILDMVYFDDELISWAEADNNDELETPTKDCNGTILQSGDTVTLIKDLDVKGAGFTAKRGTAVRNISLTSNPEHIEGKVNGTRIVLLTCFLKK